ncbi:MAG: OmpH family outer membrane protein [Deltaproteobacteria bacterium]|nr:OmpH family outer membrane protein [Deltaproteobacteria bacterium]
MMKGMLAVLVSCSFLSLPMAVAAESPATSLKIGLVDFQKVLNSVEQGKKAKEALKAEFDTKQKKLDLQQNELKKIRDEVEKQRLVLSEEALRTKETDYKNKVMDIQKNLGEFRQSLVMKETKMTQLILDNIRKIVAEIGQKENYTLVVEKSQDAVIYAASKDDLTDRVVTIYNQRNKTPLKID